MPTHSDIVICSMLVYAFMHPNIYACNNVYKCYIYIVFNIKVIKANFSIATVILVKFFFALTHSFVLHKSV